MKTTLCTVTEKIYNSFDDAQPNLAKWKEHSLKLVFTNGCFDILHRGHFTNLIKSSMLGDKLIIGLNSDASVQKLKGITRPINKQLDRAFMLASLNFVDAVIIFSDATPLNLIKAIKPNILTKGGDYDKESIIGAKEVLEKGGEIIIMPLVANYSTTNIINKIK